MNFPTSKTLRGSPVVAAPGKLFLTGEYAVLEGVPAVLAAVARHAVAQYLPDLSPQSPVIAETVKRTIATLGDLGPALPAGSALVNTSQFRHRDSKLGLGSSAAAAVAAAGAVMAFAGVDINARRELLFAAADEGHRAAQGGVGSGGDVAAAVHGGFISFARERGATPAVRKLNRPAALEMVVFWTGKSANTPALIQSVQTWAKKDRPAYQALVDEMRQASERFIAAFDENDAVGAVKQIDAYGKLLEKLGSSASVPIMTPAFGEAAVLARELGGAAKPSGAGGGDVGVAFFTTIAAVAEFGRRCPAGVSVLDVKVDPDGVRRRQPGSVELT